MLSLFQYVIDDHLTTDHCFAGKVTGNVKVPLRFWEIDQCFKCPVIGMCLTHSEQQRILKKTGISTKGKSPFEIHETIVASSSGDNPLSRRLDNALNRKFIKRLATLLKLNDATFKCHFDQAFKMGDYIAFIWAAAIHPNLSMEVKRKIFGHIHMTMHWNGEQCIQMKQKMVRLEKDIERLRQQSENFRRMRRETQKENEKLKKGK